VKKRTFSEIRILLLKSLSNSRRTINELSRISGVNWKTTENHLTYLVGKGLVREIVNSPYARIFELSEKGKEVCSGK